MGTFLELDNSHQRGRKCEKERAGRKKNWQNGVSRKYSEFVLDWKEKRI